MDGSEAQLVFGWNICYNLVGILRVADAAFLLSSKQGIQQGLDLNVDDGNGMGGGFQ